MSKKDKDLRKEKAKQYDVKVRTRDALPEDFIERHKGDAIVFMLSGKANGETNEGSYHCKLIYHEQIIDLQSKTCEAHNRPAAMLIGIMNICQVLPKGMTLHIVDCRRIGFYSSQLHDTSNTNLVNDVLELCKSRRIALRELTLDVKSNELKKMVPELPRVVSEVNSYIDVKNDEFNQDKFIEANADKTILATTIEAETNGLGLRCWRMLNKESNIKFVDGLAQGGDTNNILSGLKKIIELHIQRNSDLVVVADQNLGFNGTDCKKNMELLLDVALICAKKSIKITPTVIQKGKQEIQGIVSKRTNNQSVVLLKKAEKQNRQK